MHKGIYAYPWDLADERLDTALARIRGAGINTITLAASSHAGACLRPHGGTEVDPTADGTVCFRARPERYGHIRPCVHPMVDEFDALARLQRAAPDLRRAAWVVGCRNGPLGAQHPEYVSRDAFGVPQADRLCPAHPAVRDYVVNLCADLADGYDVAAVVLEAPGWLPHDQVRHPAGAKAPLDRFARTLLSLCFADTTRHAAKATGVDADRLQAKARALLERHRVADLALPDELAAERWSAELVSEPEWAALLHWRCRQVADLVAAVKSALPVGTDLAVVPSAPHPSARSWLEGSDPALLAAAADALEIPACQERLVDLHREASDLRRRAGDEAALHFILAPGDQDCASAGLAPGDRGPVDGATMLEAALVLKRIGVAGIAFYHYGRFGPAGFAAIKTALDALEQ